MQLKTTLKFFYKPSLNVKNQKIALPNNTIETLYYYLQELAKVLISCFMLPYNGA